MKETGRQQVEMMVKKHNENKTKQNKTKQNKNKYKSGNVVERKGLQTESKRVDQN